MVNPSAPGSSAAAVELSLVKELDSAFRNLDPRGRLSLLCERVAGPLVFTTSFGLEDQVLTHWIAGAGLAVSFVTLDTGRLFPETHAVWAATEQRYGIRVRAFYPDTVSVETLVAAQGIDGLYASKAARVACCTVRKVAPLGRALRGAAAWITGLRADQSAARAGAAFVASDSVHGLLKANPLLDWTRGRLAEVAAAEDIPVNRLHARGFLSIGCAPCTRAVAPNGAERSGRWWWEEESGRECGLHLTPDGRLVRAGAAS